MSKYRHHGQIFPIYLALETRGQRPKTDLDSFLEEVIVRRELSMNFWHFAPDYDSFSCALDWAKRIPRQHAKDERDPLHDREQFENAGSDDTYWNAAKNETRVTGFMHNHMRMYWGGRSSSRPKKPSSLALARQQVLGGLPRPELLRQCRPYFVNHDRGWKEREVPSKVRYISAGGLERKAKPKAVRREGRAPRRGLPRRGALSHPPLSGRPGYRLWRCRGRGCGPRRCPRRCGRSLGCSCGA